MLSPMTLSQPVRSPCPPGACICEREQLLATPDTDLRILGLTRQAEKVLLDALLHDRLARFARIIVEHEIVVASW